ncbi:MAG: hypothetical protein D6798_13710, partial [Deltaproteobacteria bacterium]
FAAILDARPDIEVVNLGAPAMDSFELVRLAAQLSPVPHDLLVVYTGHNDYGNTWFQGRFGDIGAGITARLDAALSRTQLYSRLRAMLRPPTGSPVPLGPGDRRALDPRQRQATTDNLARNLRRIAWISQRRGVPVVLVTPASNLFVRPQGRDHGGADSAVAHWKAGMQASDPAVATMELRAARDLDPIPLRAPGEAAEAVRSVARETGALLVDAERHLPRDPRADAPAATLFVDLVHFSAEGHEAMARLLEPVVVATLTGTEAP